MKSNQHHTVTEDESREESFDIRVNGDKVRAKQATIVRRTRTESVRIDQEERTHVPGNFAARNPYPPYTVDELLRQLSR